MPCFLGTLCMQVQLKPIATASIYRHRCQVWQRSIFSSRRVEMQHSRSLLHLAQRSRCLPYLGLVLNEANICALSDTSHHLRSIVSLTQLPLFVTAQQTASASSELYHRPTPALQLPAQQQQRHLFGLSADDLHKDYKERRLIGYRYDMTTWHLFCIYSCRYLCVRGCVIQVRQQHCCRYSPKQLYDIVAGVQNYKEFVPWCQRSHILKREGDTFLEAELEVGFRLFVER